MRVVDEVKNTVSDNCYVLGKQSMVGKGKFLVLVEVVASMNKLDF